MAERHTTFSCDLAAGLASFALRSRFCCALFPWIGREYQHFESMSWVYPFSAGPLTLPMFTDVPKILILKARLRWRISAGLSCGIADCLVSGVCGKVGKEDG